MKRIVLFGAGGHAKVVLESIQVSGSAQAVGLIDQNKALHGTKVLDVPVLGDEAMLPDIIQKFGCDSFSVGIGGLNSFSVRKKLFQLALDHGLEPFIAQHPSAVTMLSADIGDGCQLLPQSVVHSSAVLHENVIVNTAAVVEHDCVVGAHAHIAPRACLAGGVHIGSETHIGLGAVILENLRVGARCVVGGGAVVIRDLPDESVVAGVPARPIAKTKT